MYGGGLTGKGVSNNMAGINVSYAVMYISMPVTGVLNLFAVIGIITVIVETLRYIVIPFLVYLNVLSGGAL